ncbi:MAG: hypothetical protein ACTHKE_09200 [Sphingomicrobium sp.]
MAQAELVCRSPNARQLRKDDPSATATLVYDFLSLLLAKSVPGSGGFQSRLVEAPWNPSAIDEFYRDWSITWALLRIAANADEA